MPRKRHIHGGTEASSRSVYQPDVTGDALTRLESLSYSSPTWHDIMPDPANGTGAVPGFPVFDEANPDIVNLGIPTKLNFSGAFTITAWAFQEIDSSQGLEYFISRDNSNSHPNRCYGCVSRDSNGKPRFLFWDDTKTLLVCQGAGEYNAEKYYFYTFVNQGPIAGGKLQLWVDGVLDAEIANGTGVMNINAAQDHSIGGSAQGPPAAFTGNCDTVRYYNRALSPDEILRDYHADKPAHP